MVREPSCTCMSPRAMDEPPAKPRVLVVEDEFALRRLLRLCLQRNGFDVTESATGDEGLAALENESFDAVLLDMSLPDMNGLSVLTRFREWSQTPVLALSESTSDNQKITVLDSGANDYITKPFSTGELLARLRVTQRYARQQHAPQTVFRAGDLSVDLSNRTVHIKGERANLTPTEYSLLRLFIRNAGKVLTHRQIFREVWGESRRPDLSYIRVYLGRMRSKLPRELIETEPGVGYRLAVSAGN